MSTATPLRRIDARSRDLGGPQELDDLRSSAKVKIDDASLEVVRGILERVRIEGDSAVRTFTEQFDRCEIEDLRVPAEECEAALAGLPADLRAALELAAERIEQYHRAQGAAVSDVLVDLGGISLSELHRPVDRAGCYVPGGRATYPSTVLMCAIPAKIAGVGAIVLCVPPGPNGRVPKVTLAAAYLVGVDEVYRVGGAQAIAAMAYGTESISPVDVIVGPGNSYVQLAKREVAGIVGIDGFAGPSEIVVVAGPGADPRYVAADMLAQAEHGPGGQATLVTWDTGIADAIDDAISALLAESPKREQISATLVAGGRTVIVDNAETAISVVNAIAPEHVELLVEDPLELLPLVRHAGAVFCGAFAPAALGDYLAGVNHVLPTGRAARFSGALRVSTFTKPMHVVSATRAGLEVLAGPLDIIAKAEGLPFHAKSVQMRVEAP